MTYDNTQALKQFKAINEDKTLELNGRTYTLSNTTHQQRLQVFNYFKNTGGDIDYLSKEWLAIQKVLDNIILFDGQALSRLPNHWDEYEEDFIFLYTGAMGGLSYPFLKGKAPAFLSQ